MASLLTGWGLFYSLSPAGLYSILTNHWKSVYLRYNNAFLCGILK
nr:MAG TPA: hypothetical protein [Caudoviricetes sp.]